MFRFKADTNAAIHRSCQPLQRIELRFDQPRFQPGQLGLLHASTRGEFALAPAALCAQLDQLPNHRKTRRQILISVVHLRVRQQAAAHLTPAGVVP